MVGKSGDEYDDDDSIPRETKLLRRIAPGQVTKDDHKERPRSNAFANHPDGSGTSVDIWETGREPADMLVDYDDFGLVWLTVGDVRDAELGVIRAEQSDNPHHAHIQGRKTTARKRRLAKAARWIKQPESLA